EARAALIKTVEKIAVDPLEIEQQRNCLPHANIGKDLAPRVEYVIRSRFGLAVREGFFDNAPGALGRDIVLRLPAGRIPLSAHVVETSLERFEIRIGVTIIVDAQF